VADPGAEGRVSPGAAFPDAVAVGRGDGGWGPLAPLAAARVTRPARPGRSFQAEPFPPRVPSPVPAFSCHACQRTAARQEVWSVSVPRDQTRPSAEYVRAAAPAAGCRGGRRPVTGRVVEAGTAPGDCEGTGAAARPGAGATIPGRQTNAAAREWSPASRLCPKLRSGSLSRRVVSGDIGVKGIQRTAVPPPGIVTPGRRRTPDAARPEPDRPIVKLRGGTPFRHLPRPAPVKGRA
jgi:hypothetical protein